MASKSNIALLYGGYSNEASVSLNSAREVFSYLDHDRFRVFPIEITKNEWYYHPFDSIRIKINKDNFSITITDEVVLIDACFIAVHGSPGEDGKLQGYLDMLNIPYTSVGSIESAITFNKRYAIGVANYYDIPTAKHLFFLKHEIIDIPTLKSNIKLPFFVKPCKSGSSLGISLITEWNGLEKALSIALSEDDEIMLEEKINGQTYTIGVYKIGKQLFLAPPLLCQLKDTTKSFFDYETKTTKNDFSSLESNTLSVLDLKQINDFAKKVFRVFGDRGIMRIDTVLNEIDRKFHLLEVNSVPGFTEHSAFPAMIKAMGLELATLYNELVEDAINQNLSY